MNIKHIWVYGRPKEGNVHVYDEEAERWSAAQNQGETYIFN